MPSASTGMIWFDILLRPFFKFGMKFPLVGLLCLLALYGAVAYFALKSAYLDLDY
ncbi:MAG TPA: hypothetical protein V6C97_11465 [Oculatellaceae cyanobacterium]